MEDASAYSIGLAMSTWPKGAQKVFVAAATDTISIGVTIPAAKSQNAPLLLVDPAAPDQVLAAIGKLGAQDAVLVGPGFSPKNALRQQINAITTTQQWIGGAGPLEVDVPLSSMFAAPTEEAVVTDARSTADLVTSSSAAALEGAPLLTVGPSLDTWEESELARLKPKRVVFVGDAVATSAALSKLESLGYPTFSVEGADPVTRNQKVADLLRGRNLDTRRFHVSVPQAAAAAVPAAYKAALEGSIVRFAGSGTSLTGELADEAAAWGIESTNGTVIGTAAAVADSFLADLEKAMTKPRAPKPDFQALGSSTSGGVHTLEMSTQPGAALYRLFDLSGTRVSEASAPVFVLPDGQSTFSAKAYSATGALLAERDVRVVIADEEKSTANVASVITSDGQASVVNWKQHADDTRPRTVIRSEIVRATDGTLAVQGQTLIGMTCGTEYVDSSRPAGREVAYEVSQDGTDVGNICTSTEPNHSELREEITLTSARVPAIQSTAPAKASLLGSLSMASTSPSTSPDAPTPTLVEQAFMDSRQQAASPSAGSGMTPMTAQSASPLPWTFRYQTFIADQYVRPADWDTQVFDGNNRGFGAWIDRYKTPTSPTTSMPTGEYRAPRSASLSGPPRSTAAQWDPSHAVPTSGGTVNFSV